MARVTDAGKKPGGVQPGKKGRKGGKPTAQPIWKRQLDNMFEFADWALELLGDEHVDVCLVHDSLGLDAARSIAEKTGCKLVYDAVEFPEYFGRSGVSARIYEHFNRGTRVLHLHEADIIKRMSVIIAGTRGVAEWYREQASFGSPDVVRNCREFEEVGTDKRIREDCGLRDGEKLILYPNGAFPTCGIENCLEALQFLPDSIHLAVMGRMSRGMEVELRKKLQKPFLAKRFHLLPLKSPDELIQYRSGADLSLIPLVPEVPNHRTCLPNRVFESIMSRLPLIISDLPYVREVVEQYDCGAVFESNEPEVIAGVFEHSLSDARLAELKANVDKAAHDLCWENEKKVFLRAMKPVLGTGNKLNIVMVANKTVNTNNRYYRHSKALRALGHNILSLTLEAPFPELKVPGIRYRGKVGPQQDKLGTMGLMAPPPSNALKNAPDAAQQPAPTRTQLRADAAKVGKTKNGRFLGRWLSALAGIAQRGGAATASPPAPAKEPKKGRKKGPKKGPKLAVPAKAPAAARPAVANPDDAQAEAVAAARAEVERLNQELLRARGQVKNMRDRFERIRSANEILLQHDARKFPLWQRHVRKVFDFSDFCVRQLKDDDIGLCVAHDTYALEAAFCLQEQKGFPVLYDAVEVPDYRNRSEGAREGFREQHRGAAMMLEHELGLIRHASAITAISPGLADVVANELGVDRPFVLRNCRRYQDEPQTAGIRDLCKAGPDDRLVLNLNNVSPGDGLQYTLRAIAMLPENVKFVFLGQVMRTDDGRNLEDVVDEFGVADRVIKLDYFDPMDLIGAIHGADATIIGRRPSNPNNVISLPNRIFESAMARVPLAVSNAPEIESIVRAHDLGVVFDPSDPDDIAARLKEILDPEKNRQYRANADRAVRETLNWEKEQAQFIAAIEKSLGGATRPRGRTVLIADKRLERNDRVFRMCGTLLELDHEVTVCAAERPMLELTHDRVDYRTVEDEKVAIAAAAGEAARVLGQGDRGMMDLQSAGGAL